MIIVNSEGLWIKPITKRRIDNKHGWAELQVKYDSENDLTTGFFDVLVGRRTDGKLKLHCIISLEGKIISLQHRKVTQSVAQKIESELHGKISEEALILKPTTPKLPVDIKVDYVGSTKEVILRDFRFKDSIIFE